jgi:hypothetical protein
LQAFYATEAVQDAFVDLWYRELPTLILDSVDGDDDDVVVVGNEMDPITFARYYGARIPPLAKMVQDHDDKMRERLVEGVSTWLKGVQSAGASETV